MARVSALTGIAPQYLYDLDADVWAELVEAVETRWSQVEEMLTFQAELLHELIRVQLARARQTVPAPIRLPRPFDGEPRPPRRLSSADELAAFLTGFGAGRG